MTDPISWELGLRALLDLLCYIVQCDAKSDDIQSVVSGFVASYNANGVKSDLSSAERVQAIQDALDALDMAVTDPGVLTAAQRAELVDTLDNVTADLGN